MSVPQNDRKLKDKITPISVVMEYSLDYQQAADATGLLPILDMSAPANVTKQVTHLVLTVLMVLMVWTPNITLFLLLPLLPFLPSSLLRPTSCWTVETTTSVSLT